MLFFIVLPVHVLLPITPRSAPNPKGVLLAPRPLRGIPDSCSGRDFGGGGQNPTRADRVALENDTEKSIS